MPRVTRHRGTTLRALLAVTAALLVMLTASPALAVPVGDPVDPDVRSNTELTLTGLGFGQAVTGAIAPVDSSFDPVTEVYPSTIPVGFVGLNEGFAGALEARPPGPAEPTTLLYCIDIRTETRIGYGYELGTWNESNVDNVGYVAQLLDRYYPNTNEPAGLSDNARAAAVQAAIWYFTDKYVLQPSDALHDAVAGIVSAVKLAGPVDNPEPPTLDLSPTSISGPAGSLLGPYTVTGSSDAITVAANDGDMFADAAGTIPIPDLSIVTSGTRIWLRNTAGPTTATLIARAEATVPSGNVYLYDGNQSGVSQAQRLILAQEITLSTAVAATAQFLAPGSLVVGKTIAGPAASSHGPVTIVADCGDGVNRTVTIPANVTTVDPTTFTGIPAGAECTVTETVNGSSVTVTATVTGSPTTVQIPAGGSATVGITDTYDQAPGSLLVRKIITGDAAAAHGPVTIVADCNDGLDRTVTIPSGAGTPPDTTFDNIRANSICTVTETVDGSTSTVTVTVDGNDATVPIPAGGTASAEVTDTYDYAPGSLVVAKSITGPAVGQQDAIVINADCGDGIARQLVILAGTTDPAVSQSFDSIPAGTVCTITETVDGSTSTITVTATGSPAAADIPAGGTATVQLANYYSQRTSPTDPTNPTSPTDPPHPTGQDTGDNPLAPTGVSSSLTTVMFVGLTLALIGSLMLVLSRRRRRTVRNQNLH